MSGSENAAPMLSYAQVEADLVLAKHAISDAKTADNRLSKYLKGQAGYHLQQAAEKLIKIQLYQSGQKLDYSKIYKHNIAELIAYADALRVPIDIPAYVRKQDEQMTHWEAEGRYSFRVVIRFDTLEKAYKEIKAWFQSLREKNKCKKY